VLVRLCARLPSPSQLHGLVLSVFVGVELGIGVVLLCEYLVGCRCDAWEGNGVTKGVLDGLLRVG
jgi:hypothetical protein